MRGRVLIIAGSDSGGGAGIQADIKTVTALGGYAATALTALTAQNTLGVQGVLPVPTDFVIRQIDSVLDDIGADAVKTGMLATIATTDAVAERLASMTAPLVVDPVLAATWGQSLLEGGGIEALRRLIGRAALVTPNLPEAAALTRLPVRSIGEMAAAGRALLALGAGAALVKGGHLQGDELVDLLVTPEETIRFPGRRIDSTSTHGTGCTLASAIATRLAQGRALAEAVGEAIDYVRRAIASAPGYGRGHGPLNHAHALPLVRPPGPNGLAGGTVLE